MPRKQNKPAIVYAPAAVDDMDVVFAYIAPDNMAAAEALLTRLDRAISGLADFPNMGTVLPDEEYTLVKRGFRFLVVDPYLVFYRIMSNRIVIHRILHGRRDYLREIFTP